MAQARNYCFTINFKDFREIPQLCPEEWPQWIGYAIWQLEIGEEGVPHYQGYLECIGKKSMIQLHEIEDFARARFAVRHGSQQSNILYCSKEEGRLEGPFVHGTPKEQGRRSDLLDVRDQVQSKRPISELYENNFATMIRYGKAIKEYKRTVTRPRDFKSTVILIVGPAGTGKSRFAHQLARSLGSVYKVPFPKGSGLYWDDYDGQDVVILDEFDGYYMRPTDFNGLCDRYEHTVPVHGGAGHQFVSKYILIISNYHPKFWWKKRSQHQLQQTMRRIDIFIPMLWPIDKPKVPPLGFSWRLNLN